MVVHVTNARIPLELKFIAVRMYKDNMWRIFYILILFMCGFKAAMGEYLRSHMETVHKDIYSEGSIKG